MLALLTHCGSESGTTTGPSPDRSGSGNRAPFIKSAKLLNNPPILSEPAAVQIDAEDPEREAVSFRYQWYVNDAPLVGQTGATLEPSLFRRGRTVSVEIVPSDGNHEGQPYRTAAVPVGNTPPRVISVSLTPEVVHSGDRLLAQVDTFDLDHDLVDLHYRWFKNNMVVNESKDPFLDTKGFRARDVIVVEVTARDSSVTGNSLRSDPIALRNAPPKIISIPPGPAASDRFEYLVRAEDSDGDPLTYKLETGPRGMTIDEKSGYLTWPIPSDEHGTAHVKVGATDGQGGSAYQEFDLIFSVPAPLNPTGG
jgi:hypothetical protein